MPITDVSSRAVLQVGSKGADVTHWQEFLAEQKLMPADKVDGDFGPRTKQATELFQSAHGLGADGVVGANTWKAAAALNASVQAGGGVSVGVAVGTSPDAQWPSLPSFPALTEQERERLFGKFAYRPAPTADNPEAIQMLDSWQKDNIVTIQVPQLTSVPYSWTTQPNSGRVQFHRKAAPQLQALWAAWQNAGLLPRVVSYGGGYAPRLQRNSTNLSNHSFGTAFDINVKENPLGKTPAARGTPGSVVDLVSIANEHGFYWGGHFRHRPDGMHFEVAVLK